MRSCQRYAWIYTNWFLLLKGCEKPWSVYYCGPLSYLPLCNLQTFILSLHCPRVESLLPHIRNGSSVDCFKSPLMRDQEINDLITKSYYH